MISSPGHAFNRLDDDARRGIYSMLEARRRRYAQAMRLERVETGVILLADRPGPGRPVDPGYHHTPFYSTRNSSLWINCRLWELQVPENRLLWLNTTLADGQPLDTQVLFNQLGPGRAIICLGAHADRWLRERARHTGEYARVPHPQAWRRFHSRQPYPLLGLLQQALDL